MKIGIVVNDIATECADYTTTHLALAALRRGHDVWYLGLSDFAFDPDERVHGRAYVAGTKKYRTAHTLLNGLQSGDALRERITVDELDVLLLRNDPAEDSLARPWARLTGINFGRLASRRGVIVLNDPDGLYHAVNKVYLQLFPRTVRPRTLITRDPGEIRSFARREGGHMVLKPLSGSGGHNVFLVRPEDRPNLNQMIEAILHEGYAIAQEYLPDAVKGDTRLFMMNGELIQKDGEFAAIHRLRPGEDMRSNMAVGGRAVRAQITDTMRELADQVRPRLIRDGMFLVGLDVAGDKVMEINVFSPGGLPEATRITGVDFAPTVIAALERKVAYRDQGSATLRNVELATL